MSMEKKVKQKRVNVDLPEEIVVQMKVQAAQDRISIRQFVMAAVLLSLGNKKKEGLYAKSKDV